MASSFSCPVISVPRSSSRSNATHSIGELKNLNFLNPKKWKTRFLGLKFEWNLSVNTLRSGTDYCWLYCGETACFKKSCRRKKCATRTFFIISSQDPIFLPITGTKISNIVAKITFFNYFYLFTKGQTNSRLFFQAHVSSKNWAKKFDFNTCRLVIICFLEESKGTKQTLRN